MLVEQAKGVLAERGGMDPREAFTLLRNHARSHNQRLTEVATGVINATTTINVPTPHR